MNAPNGRHAWTVTVGTKGQIVIPKEARDLFHIQPGDTLLFLADEAQGMTIPSKADFARLFDLIFGESGMNIAFFCIPAHGHTNPTLAVVLSLIHI